MLRSDHYPMSPSSVDLLNMAHGLGFSTSTTSSPDTQENDLEDMLSYDSEGASQWRSSAASSEGAASTGSWLERGSLGTPRARSPPSRGFSATKLVNEFPSPFDEVPHSCSSAIPPFRPPGRKVPLTRAAPTPEAAALLAAQPELFNSVERFCLRNGFDACDLRAPATLEDLQFCGAKVSKAKKTPPSRPRRAAQRGPFWWHTEMTPLNYARHARETTVVAYLEALGLDAHNLNGAKPRSTSRTLQGEYKAPPRNWNLLPGPSPPTANAPPARRPLCCRTTNRAAAQWAAAKCQAAAAEREAMKMKDMAEKKTSSSAQYEKVNNCEVARSRNDNEEWSEESNDESEVMLVEPYLSEQCPSGQPLRTVVALPAGTAEGLSRAINEVYVDQLMDSVYHLQALPSQAGCDESGNSIQQANDHGECMLTEECELESGELPKAVQSQRRAPPAGAAIKSKAELKRHTDAQLSRKGLKRSSTITSVADFENEFGNSAVVEFPASTSTSEEVPVALKQLNRLKKFTCHLVSDAQYAETKTNAYSGSWSSECPVAVSSLNDNDKVSLNPPPKTAPGTPVSAASVAATLFAEVAERNALRRSRKKRAMNFAEETATSDAAAAPSGVENAMLQPLQHGNQCSPNGTEIVHDEIKKTQVKAGAPLLLFDPSDFEDPSSCFAQQGNEENERPLATNSGENGDASEDPPPKRHKSLVMAPHQSPRGALSNSARGGAAHGSFIRWCALA